VSALSAPGIGIPQRQRDRRNLTHAELAGFVARGMAALDRVKPEGRPSKTASIEAVSGRSSEQTAATLGVSRAQVERVRAVLASENEAVKAQLHAGQITINAAFAALCMLGNSPTRIRARMSGRSRAMRAVRYSADLSPRGIRVVTLPLFACSSFVGRR